jgi:hypothetical protein
MKLRLTTYLVMLPLLGALISCGSAPQSQASSDGSQAMVASRSVKPKLPPVNPPAPTPTPSPSCADDFDCAVGGEGPGFGGGIGAHAPGLPGMQGD